MAPKFSASPQHLRSLGFNVPCDFFVFFQISGRLFSDSPRRSSRLSGDASVNANPNTTAVSGNGTNYSSKHLGGSKPSSRAFRSVTVRKGQAWANENVDEGDESLFITLFNIIVFEGC